MSVTRVNANTSRRRSCVSVPALSALTLRCDVDRETL